MKKIIGIILLCLTSSLFAQDIYPHEQHRALNMSEKGWLMVKESKNSDTALMRKSLIQDSKFHSIIGRSRMIDDNHIITYSEYVKIFITVDDCQKRKGKMVSYDLVRKTNNTNQFDLYKNVEGDEATLHEIVKLTCAYI